jgi:anti-sigma factor RsiW
MSRDAEDRPAPPSAAPRATTDLDDAAAARVARRDPGALLSAYVDGIAELAVDERRGVDTWLDADPAARTEAAAVQSLLGRLRAMPPEPGDEPDWSAMERSIRLAVADAPIRRWWQSWRWLVPAMTCATAAALLFALWPRTVPVVPERPRPASGAGEQVRAAVAEPTEHGDRAERAEHGDRAEHAGERDTVALWLDGSEVDVDLSAPAAGDMLGEGAAGVAEHGELSPAGAPDEASDDFGLLPATDLAWVDGLDDAALDRAERWLAGRAGKKG